MDRDKIYDNLREQLSNIYSDWIIYSQVYGHSEERIILLNKVASSFFYSMQNSLLYSIILSISRFTDPIKTHKKENITIELILKIIDKDTDNTFYNEVSNLIDDFKTKCTPFRKWRNRLIAHSDLPTYLNYRPDPLPGISRYLIKEVISMASDIMNRYGTKYYNTTTRYEDFIHQGGTGESLIFYLDYALKLRNIEFELKKKGIDMFEYLRRIT